MHDNWITDNKPSRFYNLLTICTGALLFVWAASRLDSHNMVLNAVDAMPQGGRLTLATQDAGDFVVVSVADTGTGMTPDVCSRIFDPFFTTKGKPMGLGLAVSFGIIRRHGGTIEVDSEIGRGTTFKITLPVAECSSVEQLIAEVPAETHVNVESPSRATMERQPNILAVDDEQCVRQLLQEILEAEGCRVYTASGGREAIALMDAREFQGEFTDVGMPGMSGWELAHVIRQRSNIPIAVVTGWGDAVGSIEQKEAGVDWVVTKPFTAERIMELARELGRLHQTTPNRDAVSPVAA